MASNFKIVGLDRIIRAFKLLPQETKKIAQEATTQAMIPIQKELVYNLSNRLLRRRTSRLVNSVMILPMSGNIISGIIKVGGSTIGASVNYARILNDGGTIRKKGKGFLTIPTEYAQTGAGVLRFTARELIGSPKSFG